MFLNKLVKKYQITAGENLGVGKALQVEGSVPTRFSLNFDWENKHYGTSMRIDSKMAKNLTSKKMMASGDSWERLKFDPKEEAKVKKLGEKIAKFLDEIKNEVGPILTTIDKKLDEYHKKS